MPCDTEQIDATGICSTGFDNFYDIVMIDQAVLQTKRIERIGYGRETNEDTATVRTIGML